MTRIRRLLSALATLGALGVACSGPSSPPVLVVDLMTLVDRAERRPAGAAFDITLAGIDGQVRPALLMPVPGRITWEVAVPTHGLFRTAVALPETTWADGVGEALLRVGVGDGRVYEELWRMRLAAERPSDRRWIQVDVDLGRYGGFKWSLFYQPGRTRWKVIVNTGIVGHGTTPSIPASVSWAEPGIYRAR